MSQPISILLDGSVRVRDAAQEAANLAQLGYAAPAEFGRANSLLVPTGRDAARAEILLARGDLGALDPDAPHSLTFTDQHGRGVTLQNLVVTKEPQNLTPGVTGDAAAVYLVELADRRWLVHNPIFSVCANKRYNVRLPLLAATDFYPDSGGGWTWAGMLQDLWDTYVALPLATPWPGLPAGFTPDGTPEGYTFQGVSAWDAINHVLWELGLVVKPDLTAAAHQFAVVVVGGADDATDATLAAAQRQWRRTFDREYTAAVRGREPYGCRVTFAANVPYYAVYTLDVVGPAPDHASTEPQVYTPILDEMEAVYDAAGVLTNGTALNSRAAARTAAYFANITGTGGGRLHRVYDGVLQLQPGATIRGVAWRQDEEGGLVTEVVRHPHVEPGALGRQPAGTDWSPQTTSVSWTSDQNNYPPPGGNYLLVTTDAPRTLTGIAAPPGVTLLTVIVVGANPLVVGNENTGSTAANRILTNNTDLILVPNQSVTLLYLPTLSRWVVYATDVCCGLTTSVPTVTAGSLATDQNNYPLPPTTLLNLTSSTPVKITGFTAPVPPTQQLVYVTNTGVNNITLSYLDTSSTSTNRIDTTTSTDVVLTTGKTVLMYYNTTTSKWYVVNVPVPTEPTTPTTTAVTLTTTPVNNLATPPTQTLTVTLTVTNVTLTTIVAPPAAYPTQQLTIINSPTSTYTLTLVSLTGATPANQIKTPADVPVVLPPGTTATATYDPVTQKWVVTTPVNPTGPPVITTSTITPPAGTTNNLPLPATQLIRVDTTGGAATLTGIVAPGYPTLLILTNVGPNTLTLADLTGSSAGNQFTTPGGLDLTLQPGETANLLYDPATGSWEVQPQNVPASGAGPAWVKYTKSAADFGATTYEHVPLVTLASGTVIHNWVFTYTQWAGGGLLTALASAGFDAGNWLNLFNTQDVLTQDADHNYDFGGYDQGRLYSSRASTTNLPYVLGQTVTVEFLMQTSGIGVDAATGDLTLWLQTSQLP